MDQIHLKEEVQTSSGILNILVWHYLEAVCRTFDMDEYEEESLLSGLLTAVSHRAAAQYRAFLKLICGFVIVRFFV